MLYSVANAVTFFYLEKQNLTILDQLYFNLYMQCYVEKYTERKK